MAYDAKKLVDKLKDKGLPLAEEVAKEVEAAVLEWLEDSAKETATPIDDVVVAAVDQFLKPELDKAIDKIDGKEG